MKSKIWSDIIFALVLYILLLFRFGYDFGGGDQGEVLPFALYLQNNSLYPLDNYISSAALVWPNERFFIVSLFSFIDESYWYSWCLFLHVILAFTTFIGLRYVASLFINNYVLQWLSVFINLLFLYLYAPGGNELYYNYLIASSAVAGVWGIYYFFTQRYVWAYLILIPTTWMHPLVGLQLAILFTMSFYFTYFKHIKTHYKQIFTPILLYAILGASYVLYLKIRTDASQQNSSLSDVEFYDILYNFRNPHHFNPINFPAKTYLVSGFLLLLSIYVFLKQKITWYFIISCFILFVFASFNHLFFENFSIASLQLFKISIWTKFLGCVALLVLVEKYSSNVINKYFVNDGYHFYYSFLILIFLFPAYLFSSKFKMNFDVPQHYANHQEIDICLKAQAHTPKNALFIHPIRFTKFHYFSKRSSYVNFKVMARNKYYIETWIKRLKTVYAINEKMTEKGFAVQNIADANYLEIDTNKLHELKSKGITHMITFKEHTINNKKIIAQNESYKIIAL